MMETVITQQQGCSVLQRPVFMSLRGQWERMGVGIIHVHTGDGADMPGTGVVVTHVNARDDVYVRTHAAWNHCYIESNGGGRSSFAGWKLSWIIYG